MKKRNNKMKIHHRQAWWCWIFNDPFIPTWLRKEDEYSCPLCKSQPDKDGSWSDHEYICNLRQILKNKSL